MSENKKAQRSITFYMPDEIQDSIKKYTKSNDISASHLARKVFREFFCKEKAKK